MNKLSINKEKFKNNSKTYSENHLNFGLRQSFKYAFNGIAFCIQHERNMRVHIIATFYVFYFMQFYDLTKAEIALVILLCVLIMSLEMINTAIEVVIDKVSPLYSALAKVGKDVAAGAVFIAAIAAIVIGFVIFWDIDTIKVILGYIFYDIVSFSTFISSGLISYIFIRTGKKRKIKGKI